MQQYPSYEAYPFTNSPAVQLGVADNYATLPKVNRNNKKKKPTQPNTNKQQTHSLLQQLFLLSFLNHNLPPFPRLEMF